MIPVSQKRAQRRHKGKRLVKHHMMARLRDLDHGRGPTQQIEHIFPDLGRQQHGKLSPHDGNAAARLGKARAHIANVETLPDGGIKLPRPPLPAFRCLHPLQRVSRDIIDDIAVLAGLRRRQAETLHPASSVG